MTSRLNPYLDFEQPAAGGTTDMPLQKQVRGDEFGMCTDKFGISQPQA